MRSLVLAAFLVLTPAALAGDWYVDAVGGSNSNSGTSPGDAFRTITFAIGQLGGAGVHTVHVLPGTYDAGLGELFPLALHGGLTVVGELGREVTFVAGPLLATGPALFRGTSGDVSDLTLRGGGAGVELSTPWGEPPQGTIERCRIEPAGWGVVYSFANDTGNGGGMVLRDVEIVGAQHGGVLMSGDSGFTVSVGVVLENVRVEDCALAALDVTARGDVPIWLTLRDCDVRRNGAGAILTGESDGLASLNAERCVFEGNTGPAVEARRVNSAGMVSGVLSESLLANNGAGLVSTLQNPNQLKLVGCTVVRNNGTGIGSSAQPNATRVERSILFDNGDDIDLPSSAGVTVTDSNIGDGDFQGVNGNIAVDPLFRDPDRGDFRLGFGTGCVDAVSGVAVLDLTGFERGNDGDLDLTGAADMGALELRTLSAPDTVGIGTKLHFDIHAEPGAFTALWLARGPQLPVPDPTPFGDLWLPASLLELVAMRKVLTAQPVQYTVYVPPNPILIGQLFSFQSLSRSSAAPAGAAWTDALTVVVTP